MSAQHGPDDDPREDRRDQEDRVVARSVDHGTTADESDERAYRAAGPSTEVRPDTAAGGIGGTAERAAHDLETSAEDEPTRSE
jgi:hypothetical protein